MTPRLTRTTLLLTLALGASSALAAETGNFTGFTLGATAGLTRNSMDYSGFLDGQSSSKNTLTGGINAAYGFAVNDDFVVSAGASYILNSVKFGQTTYQSGGQTVFVNGKLKDHWSVFVAAGYRFSPQWLGYGKLSYQHAKSEYTDTLMGSGTSRHHGVGYGAGLSYAVTRHIEVNAEIQHTRLSSASFALSSGKPSVTELNVGVNYRF